MPNLFFAGCWLTSPPVRACPLEGLFTAASPTAKRHVSLQGGNGYVNLSQKYMYCRIVTGGHSVLAYLASIFRAADSQSLPLRPARWS